MIYESVIGRANDSDSDVDWIDIDFRQTVRRALRLISRGGEGVDILLPRGQSLRHGDVIGISSNKRLAVFVQPCELLKLTAKSLQQIAQLALELGNLHLPTEICSDHLLTLDDGPVREIADRIGVSYELLNARFHPLPCSVQSELNVRL